MRNRRKSFLCYMMAAMLLILGMYFEDIKADSFFSYVPAEKPAFYLSSFHGGVSDAEACTAEMLGVHSSFHLQQLVNRCLSEKREVKNASVFWDKDISLQLLHCFCQPATDFASFSGWCNKAVVLTYIHNTDGKK